MTSRSHMRVRKGWLALLAAVMTAAVGAGVAVADQIANNIDGTVDSTLENVALQTGGPDRTVGLYVVPTGGDGKPGCNLTGSTTLTVATHSSNLGVATVSPATVTFTSCGDTPTLTVHPVAQGPATITVTQVSNTTGGAFQFDTASFTVTVAPPPNTAPHVSVTGVTAATRYDKGSVPTPGCLVSDTEDGLTNSTTAASPQVDPVAGPNAIDGIGQQTVRCSYTDGGGLKETASVTYEIVDPSPPSIGSTVTPATPDGDNGWYRSDVSLAWSVTEPESPHSLAKTGCVDQNIIADQAATTYSCSATSAGGSAGPVDVTIKRDATPPTITRNAAQDACSVPGDNGWCRGTQTAGFTATDLLSGFAPLAAPTVDFTQSTTTEGPAVTVSSGTKTDLAGNTSGQIDAGPFKIDATKPQNAVTGVQNGQTYTLGSVPTAGCSTTDPGGANASGVAASATVSVSGPASGVGSFTATCTGGKDNAGNSADAASVTYSVVYNFHGFFQPVDNGGVFNVAKAGSAIPVKFDLSGNQGLGILAAGSPAVSAAQCPSSTTLQDTIEETSAATNSGLQFDATANLPFGQYIYVWKTAASFAGTCKMLNVKLIDGTSHTAFFKFTK
jgi:hypothetical protein